MPITDARYRYCHKAVITVNTYLVLDCSSSSTMATIRCNWKPVAELLADFELDSVWQQLICTGHDSESETLVALRHVDIMRMSHP